MALSELRGSFMSCLVFLCGVPGRIRSTVFDLRVHTLAAGLILPLGRSLEGTILQDNVSDEPNVIAQFNAQFTNVKQQDTEKMRRLVRELEDPKRTVFALVAYNNQLALDVRIHDEKLTKLRY